MSPRVDLPRVADAEPEQEPTVPRVREHPRSVGGSDGVAAPDVRDPRRDPDALGRRKQHRAVGERLARAQPLRAPERVVAELVDLPCRRPGRRCGRDGEGAGPDPDAPQPQGGDAHEAALLALTSAVTVSFTGAASPSSPRGRWDRAVDHVDLAGTTGEHVEQHRRSRVGDLLAEGADVRDGIIEVQRDPTRPGDVVSLLRAARSDPPRGFVLQHARGSAVRGSRTSR